MDKKSFSIDYNGKKAECTDLGDSFMVQLTYKPLYIQMVRDKDGVDHWVEKEGNRETPLSKELGTLISKQYRS